MAASQESPCFLFWPLACDIYSHVTCHPYFPLSCILLPHVIYYSLVRRTADAETKVPSAQNLVLLWVFSFQLAVGSENGFTWFSCCQGFCLPGLFHFFTCPFSRGYWGTTDDFSTSFLHFSLFSTALWDLVNSRPVHFLMLSSKLFFCLACPLPPFTVPFTCKMVLARRNEWETCPCYSVSFSPPALFERLCATWTVIKTCDLMTCVSVALVNLGSWLGIKYQSISILLLFATNYSLVIYSLSSAWRHQWPTFCCRHKLVPNVIDQKFLRALDGHWKTPFAEHGHCQPFVVLKFLQIWHEYKCNF